jgi:small GTP-binding protein
MERDLTFTDCHPAGYAHENAPVADRAGPHQRISGRAHWIAIPSCKADMIQKKIALLGMYAVGKTSLVKRFVSSVFDEKYHTTMGVKIDKKVVRVKGQDLMLMLWDVAGAEEDFTVPASYIRGSAGYLLVIDGTRIESLDRGFDLVAQVEGNLGKIPFVAILNKIDLVEQWKLDETHLQRLAAFGCPVIRSSALTGEGVETAFQTLAERLV